MYVARMFAYASIHALILIHVYRASRDLSSEPSDNKGVACNAQLFNRKWSSNRAMAKASVLVSSDVHHGASGTPSEKVLILHYMGLHTDLSQHWIYTGFVCAPLIRVQLCQGLCSVGLENSREVMSKKCVQMWMLPPLIRVTSVMKMVTWYYHHSTRLFQMSST